MSKFAQGTDVTPEKSQMQISKMLRDFKCSGVPGPELIYRVFVTVVAQALIIYVWVSK